MRGLVALLGVGVVVVVLVGCLAGPNPGDMSDAPVTQCELCHAQIDSAFKLTKHAKANSTCQTCHGRSAEHSWSEDGSVAPTRLLKTRPQVDKLCNTCHKDHKHKLPLQRDRRCSACHDPHPHEKDDKEAAEPREHDRRDLTWLPLPGRASESFS